MHLLLVDNGGDCASYLDSFRRLSSLQGVRISYIGKEQTNASVLAAVCKKAGIDGIICAQLTLLNTLLNASADFIRHKKTKVTQDLYAGSFLQCGSIPVVAINPLDRLMTVPYESFVVDRYIAKLTRPSRWFKPPAFKWRMVTDEKDAEAVLARLEQARLIGIDIETPNPIDEIRSISCVSYTAYFSDTHTTESYAIGFDEIWMWRFVQRANANPVVKVFQNGPYDNTYFSRWNCPVNNWLHDTNYLFHCWLSELPKSLDFISTFVLREVRYWKDDGKSGQFSDLCCYCCRDSWNTVCSLLALMREVPEWAINNYYQEFPLAFPALTAGLEGVRIDIDKFKEVAKKKQEEVESIRARLSKILGVDDFNPNSHIQVGALFKFLGVGYLGSTDKAAMLKARAAHPFNDLILGMVVEYRAASKLVSNYFDEDKLWNGRLFYSFVIPGTDSGRSACKESNYWCGFQIQNIPRGDTVKQCFLSELGWYWAEPDKAQSEARCVGYLSGDTNLIDLVESPHDYHSWNANKFFGVPYEQIYNEATKETLDKVLRDLSKRTNHGANYNMGAQVMLDTMGPKLVAKAKKVLKLPALWRLVDVTAYLLDQYERTYPAVKRDWYQHIIATIEMTKMLISPLGWTRLFFGRPSKNKQALNSAVAHGPQNLSVAIINKEWYAIWRETMYGKLIGRVRIKAQIHDSLPFQYRDKQAAHEVHAMMNTTIPVTDCKGITRNFCIPTDLSLGKNGMAVRWSELK